MKSIKLVEKDRESYHKNPNRFSVHRSSLLVPNICNLNASISFLNHNLLKRKNKSVSIKLSAYKNGLLLDSFFEEITEPRVYFYDLNKKFSSYENLSSFQVEFYSSKNLFIPFPAVIIEHSSKYCKNIVHSYNRILNDIIEENNINTESVYEASFEVFKNENSCSGFIYHNGQYHTNNKIELILITNGKKNSFNIEINCRPFSTQFFSLRKYIPFDDQYSICYIKQPKQHMFFGRLLVGQFSNGNQTFSYNHSFYDSSNTEEYFSNNLSSRQYPYFSGYKNSLCFYPINSPSELKISISVSGKIFDCGIIKSPSLNYLSINVNKLFIENNINANSYEVIAESKKMNPTRINHQLLIGKLCTNIGASINVSLFNDDIYKPKNKNGFIWGPILCDVSYNSVLGILGKNSKIKCTGKLRIYDQDGLVLSKKIMIKNSSTLIISDKDLNTKFLKNSGMYWYSVESDTDNLQAFSVFTNKKTGVTSGEHNF